MSTEPLSADQSRTLDTIAERIRARGKRVVEDVVAIGQELIDAKKLAGHGNFLSWLEREFGWSEDTAQNYMNVTELSENRNFRNLDVPLSALYLLARDSTPPEAVAAIAERSQQGERLSVEEVREVIAEAKGETKAAEEETASENDDLPTLADHIRRGHARAEEAKAQMEEGQKEIEEAADKLASRAAQDPERAAAIEASIEASGMDEGMRREWEKAKARAEEKAERKAGKAREAWKSKNLPMYTQAQYERLPKFGEKPEEPEPQRTPEPTKAESNATKIAAMVAFDRSDQRKPAAAEVASADVSAPSDREAPAPAPPTPSDTSITAGTSRPNEREQWQELTRKLGLQAVVFLLCEMYPRHEIGAELMALDKIALDAARESKH